MNNLLLLSFRAEWLKQKRSAASWLTVIGALLIPVIMLIAQIVRHENTAIEVMQANYWQILHHRCWQFMAVLLLPMGVILATSLAGQTEFRNNTWKQWHATPQPLIVIFLAKLAVILTMLVIFFILFNAGIFLAGITPALILSDVNMPAAAFPLGGIAQSAGLFFIDCLPVVALQFALSIRFRNFLLPLGAGIGLLVASLIGMQWKHGHWLPYIHAPYYFQWGKNMPENIHVYALIYFVFFTVTAFMLYRLKKDKS